MGTETGDHDTPTVITRIIVSCLSESAKAPSLRLGMMFVTSDRIGLSPLRL